MSQNQSSVAVSSLDLTLTPSEREQAHHYLGQTQSAIVSSVKGLSDAQWKFKPAPDCWSIAEIVEHVVIVCGLVLGPVREQLAKAPAPPADRDYKQIDSIVMNQLSERTDKFSAPIFARPSGRFQHPSEGLDALAKCYAGLADYLESTPDLRDHILEAPPLKAITKGAFDFMDGYQWIVGAGAHAKRHVKQIQEVKADPNFPTGESYQSPN